MYKIYLSPSTQTRSFGVENYGVESFRMNQIADEVEKRLIETGKFIVSRNKEEMNKEEIINDSNNFKPDVHIALHSNYGNKQGIEVYTKVGCELSQGFAKEIYKNLQTIYYNKEIDNGVFYNDRILEIMKVNSPAVLIEAGCHENAQDAKWIVKNIEKIGEQIALGIVKGFTLKPC